MGGSIPDDLLPTWWGHSIGRWEGDTLVIDTIGYNDKFWFDSRGTPHTDKLHTIERWTRTNYGTLVNEFTLEDPGALSRPVQLKFTARLLKPKPEGRRRRTDGIYLSRGQRVRQRRRIQAGQRDEQQVGRVVGRVGGG
jgi:hypothetical protein